MPDLTDFPALDVAIGLAVMFFLLSVVCSAIQELIASIVGLRARHLTKGLKELLGEEKAADLQTRLPGDKQSYIDARQFSLALLDTLAPDEPGDSLLTQAAEAADDLPPGIKGPVKRILVDAGNDVDQARAEIEAWFNASMDRVSGWYKRRVQYILLGIALVLTLAINADSFHVARELYRDPTLRSALVQKSEQILQSGEAAQPPAGEGASAQTPTEPCPSSETASGSAKTCIEAKFKNVADSLDAVEDLKLPLGWSKENKPSESGSWASKVLGLLATIFALSLGAPFWFDVLGKVSRLRAAGAKPAGSDTNTNEPKQT